MKPYVSIILGYYTFLIAVCVYQSLPLKKEIVRWRTRVCGAVEVVVLFLWFNYPNTSEISTVQNSELSWLTDGTCSPQLQFRVQKFCPTKIWSPDNALTSPMHNPLSYSRENKENGLWLCYHHTNSTYYAEILFKNFTSLILLNTRSPIWYYWSPSAEKKIGFDWSFNVPLKVTEWSVDLNVNLSANYECFLSGMSCWSLHPFVNRKLYPCMHHFMIQLIWNLSPDCNNNSFLFVLPS